MDGFKLEPQPDEGDTNNSETLEQAVLDQQVFAQHNKFGAFPVPSGFTNNTKKSAKNDAIGFRALILIGVAAAAFHAAFTPNMKESSVASKLAEQASQPVAIPPQWLPVLFATLSPPPNQPPSPPCTDNGSGGTTGRGDWPPLPVDPSSVQCVNVSTQWQAWQACHNNGTNVGDSDEFYERCHALYEGNTCYPPGDSKFGCIQDAVSSKCTYYLLCFIY